MKHLAKVQNMIPYIVSSGHIDYAICLPIYLTEMRALPETHPSVFQSLSRGNFTVAYTVPKEISMGFELT